MKIIFTQDVKPAGKKGENKEGSHGYARNVHIGKGLAVEATAKNLSDLKQKQSSDQHKIDVAKQEAIDNANKIKGKTITYKAKAGAGGKLFGAVTAANIAEAIEKEFAIKIEKKKVSLSSEIKNFGTYTADLKFFAGVSEKITIEVVPQE